MSHPTTGDRGGNFPSIIHGQPYPDAQGPTDYNNCFPYGQDRSTFTHGTYFPVKPTNPHMAAGMRSQVQMHTGHMNQFQDVNVIQHQHQAAHPQIIAGINYGRPQEFNPHYQHMQNSPYFQIPGQQQQYQYFQNFQVNNVIPNQINNVMPNQINNVMPNQINTHAYQQPSQNGKCEIPNQSVQSSYYNTVNTCMVDSAKQEVQIKTPESKVIKYDDSTNSSPANDSSTSVCNTSNETDVSITECFANASKFKNSYNNNTFQGTTYNVASAGNCSAANRPRANSRCDSTRSEAAESTCSSLSTESCSETAQHYGQFHLYPNNYGNPYINHCFPGGQIQAAGSLNDNDTNNNMSYQNSSGGYSRANSVINKVSHCADQNLAQAFHHVDTVQQVQLQRGQLQIMQAQYQYLHGQNMGGPRPNIGLNHMHMGPINQNNSGNAITSPMNAGHNVCNMPNYCTVNQQEQFGSHKTFPSPRIPLTPQYNMMRHPNIQSCPPQMVRMQQAAYAHCEQRFVPPAGAKFSLPPAIVVPFGWKRVNNNGQVVYISPSGVNLHNLPQVVEYISQEGTCKCGLQCPLRIETSFSFDPKIPHRAMMPSELALNDTKLCNHRRKLALSFDVQKQVKKEDGRKKRKRKTKGEDIQPLENAPTVHDARTLSHVTTPQMQQAQHMQQNWNTGVTVLKPGNNCMHGPNGEATAAQTGYPQQTLCCTNPHQSCAPKFYPNHNFMQRNDCVAQDQQTTVPSNQLYPALGANNYYPPQMCHAAGPMMATGQPDSCAIAPAAEEVEKKKKTTGRAKKRRKVDAVRPPAESNPTTIAVCKTPDETASINSYSGQSTAGVPSFMEDPNGYLAQQTALLNNTMSGGGVGQFSPQGPGKCSLPFSKVTNSAVNNGDVSLAPNPMSAVVPLPSNVPLPARVSKGVTSASATTCNQTPSTSSVQTSVADSSCGSYAYNAKPSRKNSEKSSVPQDSKSSVATAESTCAGHIVTVTYTSTSTSKSDTVSRTVSPASDSNSLTSTRDNLTVSSSPVNSHLRKSSSDRASTADSLSSKLLDPDEANRPLLPGTFDGTMSTQSPLEMVQNIVSSIPVPASAEESLPTSRASLTSQYKQLTSENGPSTQNVVTPHLFNVAGSGSMTNVMYNTTGMIRAPSSLVVQGNNQSSLTSGMLVNSSANGGNVVVVTAPFNTKGPISGTTVCSTVSGVAPMVGIQGVPQVQVQPSLAQVQPHPFQQHVQSIQPVMQLVNTFATMQAPVIIHNGNNIIQQTPGMISNQAGVLCPNNMIPSSAATFVASQPILPAAAISMGNSQTTPVLKMISPNSEDGEQQTISANRLTPCQTQGSITPGSSGSDTPSSSGSSGGGRKRRKRNTTAPAPQHPPNIMPAIIMGKQIQQPIVMNNTQVSPYSAMAVPQVATVAAVGNAPGSSDNSQMLQSAAQRVNVVQMVSGPVAGALPLQVQHAPAIIVPSPATSGFIINQLSDGSFVSTDPHSGMSYPVQIQLSGSHIVGVSPLAAANGSANVIGQFATPAATAGAMVAVNAMRGAQQGVAGEAKVMNFSPAAVHPRINVYNVPTNVSPNATSNSTQYVSNEQISQNNSLQQLSTASSATVVQQKTTIVAQQTTVVATQGGNLSGTHSSVSTQTPGALGESDVTSSDNTAIEPVVSREASTSPSHQSAEISTTRQDEETMSSPDCQPCTPPHKITVAPDQMFRQNTHNVGSDCDTVSVVYGHHRGHSKWPGQVMKQVGGRIIIEWFGDRIVESVLCSCVSKCPPCRSTITRSRFRDKNCLLAALTEADSLSSRLTFSPILSRNPCLPDVNHNQIETQSVKPKRRKRNR